MTKCNCGTEFTPAVGWQQYCSRSCGEKARGKRYYHAHREAILAKQANRWKRMKKAFDDSKKRDTLSGSGGLGKGGDSSESSQAV